MKIFITADVHSEHSVKSDNLAGEKQSILVIDVLEKEIRRIKPDVFFVIGDLFDLPVIESSLACQVKDKFIKLCDDLGLTIVLVTGNHEYEEFNEKYYGSGLLTAIFGGAHKNIHVIDKTAKAVRVGEDAIIYGMPYRATYEQFKADVIDVLPRELEAVGHKKSDKIIPGWHVGLPFGATFRDDEDENAWIKHDHPDILKLFEIADDKTVFCGHYHGSDSVPSGDGKFIYIGSPATRSRSESDQEKTYIVWEDSKIERINTHLELDKIFTSVSDAGKHLSFLEEKFGPEVRQIATMHVKMPAASSMDDYRQERANASNVVGIIKIERPPQMQRSICEHIIEHHRNDPSSSREKLESDLFHFALIRQFRSESLKSLSDLDFYVLGLLGSSFWTELSEDIKKLTADVNVPAQLVEKIINGAKNATEFSEIPITFVVGHLGEDEASKIRSAGKDSAYMRSEALMLSLPKLGEKILALKGQDLEIIARYADSSDYGRTIENAVS